MGRVGNVKSFLSRLLVSDYFILYLNILIFLIACLFLPGFFLSLPNLSNILEFMWPLFAITIGQSFVLIVAGIDLSQTSVMALASVIGGFVMSSGLEADKFAKSPLWGNVISESGGVLSGSNFAVPVAIIAMLAVGVIIGLLNGLAVAKLRMPPFIVTLVTQMFFVALAILLTQSNNIINLPDSFNNIGEGKLGFISIACLISVALAIIAQIILKKSLLGRWLYAAGTNIRASFISGVPTQKVIIFAYMFSGFCAAIGAVIYSGRLQAGRPTLGQNMLMDIIGAAIIGGNSLFGGKGNVLYAFYGVIFLILISNIMNVLNLDVLLVIVLKGTIILIAAFLDVTRRRVLTRGS